MIQGPEGKNQEQNVKGNPLSAHTVFAFLSYHPRKNHIAYQCVYYIYIYIHIDRACKPQHTNVAFEILKFHPESFRFLGASLRHWWWCEEMAAAVVPLPTLPPKESYGERFTMIRITVQVTVLPELFFFS